MKKYIAILTLIAAFFIISACNQENAKSQNSANAGKAISIADEAIPFDSTAYTLLQNKCMVCHSTVGKTHDQLIAPPIIAVKRRYMMKYDERDDFIEHIVAWAKNPKEENAIMFGAVDKFKTMPYLNFEESELQKIAAFIYDQEVEKPEWFEEHFREQHPNGKMGKGHGKGKKKKS